MAAALLCLLPRCKMRWRAPREKKRRKEEVRGFLVISLIFVHLGNFLSRETVVRLLQLPTRLPPPPKRRKRRRLTGPNPLPAVGKEGIHPHR